PISATAILAEIAEDLVRAVLANHPDEKTISLLGISVSNLEKDPVVQLELPLGLEDEARRPGKGHGPLGGRPRRRHDPRSLRVGGGRVRVDRIGNFPFRSRRVPRTRRKGPVTITADRGAATADRGRGCLPGCAEGSPALSWRSAPG